MSDPIGGTSGRQNQHSTPLPPSLYGDDDIVIESHNVYTNDGAFDLTKVRGFGVRPRLHYAQILLSAAVVSALLSELGMPWLMLLATALGAASLLALFVGLMSPRTVYLRLPDREVTIYRTRNGAKLKGVLDALARAPTVRRAEEEARRKSQREAQERKQKQARAEEEHRYQALIERAANKQPMPFKEWASTQTDGHLLTSTAEYLAVRLDDAYGGPAMVDRFLERGLKHIVERDISSAWTKQSYEIEQITWGRSTTRRQIAEKHKEIALEKKKLLWGSDNRSLEASIAYDQQLIEKWRSEAHDQLYRQYTLALQLGLTRLARQYQEMM